MFNKTYKNMEGLMFFGFILVMMLLIGFFGLIFAKEQKILFTTYVNSHIYCYYRVWNMRCNSE